MNGEPLAILPDGVMQRMRVGAANGLGHGGEILDQVIEALRREIGVVLEGVVEVGDIRLVMLPVMDFHRLGVDMWLERRGGVG